MRKIANYIKSIFCKHDLIIEEMFKIEYYKDNSFKRQGDKVCMYCKKCGYNKSFWKF